MDSFIKKVFDGKSDESVHLQFIKFSRGEFKDRALISVKKTANNFSIGTSYEYANELVKTIAEKLKDNQKTKVTGAVISTRDLTNEIKFKEKKQFQGVKKYIIDEEMSKEQIINLCDKFPKAFLALSFTVVDSELRIKPKAPKSSKPKNKDDKPKADFCKVKTSDENLVKGLIFDVDDFKNINVKHDFIINEIIIPKNEKDPVKIRENSIRKGKIIRYLDIDGKKEVKEANFSI